jgi:ferritin-like metal-binding protein YciE
MMKDKRDQVVAWMQSAHAMEQSIAKVLENHADDAKGHPELETRMRTHLDETRRHAEKLERCLDAIGEKPSGGRSMLSNLMGTAQGLSTGMYNDELVKNALADYASEHFEIACYRSLAAGARTAGMPEVAQVAEEILQDEERMANWLEERIPSLTDHFLEVHLKKSA